MFTSCSLTVTSIVVILDFPTLLTPGIHYQEYKMYKNTRVQSRGGGPTPDKVTGPGPWGAGGLVARAS